MSLTAEEVINILGLIPLEPEGGFFKETYRSKEKVSKAALGGDFPKDMNYSTAIYYMLSGELKSTLHRLPIDEIWHFYLGGPLTIVELSPEGDVIKTVLGTDIANGEKLQYTVPAGTWFGAYLNSGTDYTLIGATCAPGFEYEVFEMTDESKKKELLEKFPNAREEIERLT